MIVAWLFTLLMVFAGLTALCTLWAVLGCIRDATSRNSFPSIFHAHDVERNEPARPLQNITRNTTLLATSPLQRGSPTITPSTLFGQQAEDGNRPNEPTHPLQNVSRQDSITPLPVPSPTQDETTVTMPSPVQPMDVLPRQNTAPAFLQPSPSQRLSRHELGIRRARTVAEGSGYRMVALLVPENHRIFSQRGLDRVVVQTRTSPEAAEHIANA